MFGRKAFLPIEATMQNESPDEILEEFQTAPSLESKEGFLAKLIESRANILDKAKSNISAEDPPIQDPPPSQDCASSNKHRKRPLTNSDATKKQ